jgi:RNase P/RNase MRP subunit p29
MLKIIPYICKIITKNNIMLTEKTAKLIVRKKTNITHFEAKDGEKKTKILVYVGNQGPGDAWEDCTCFLEVVNDELVIYPNDKHMQEYFEDFNFTKPNTKSND